MSGVTGRVPGGKVPPDIGRQVIQVVLTPDSGPGCVLAHRRLPFQSTRGAPQVRRHPWRQMSPVSVRGRRLNRPFLDSGSIPRPGRPPHVPGGKATRVPSDFTEDSSRRVDRGESGPGPLGSPSDTPHPGSRRRTVPRDPGLGVGGLRDRGRSGPFPTLPSPLLPPSVPELRVGCVCSCVTMGVAPSPTLRLHRPL